MGGFDVVMLRSICASYAEQHIFPALQEIRTTQGELSDSISELRKTMSESASTTNTCNQLQERMAMKADLDMVPSMQQFEALMEKIEQTHKEKEDSEIEAQLQDMSKRLDALNASIANKASLKDIVSADQLDAVTTLLDLKADSREVVSTQEFRKFASTVDRKALSNKFCTKEQHQELLAALERKVDAQLCPTLAQVEEISQEVKRKKVNSQGLDEARKVGSDLAELQQKVDLIMTRKADSAEVPSLMQHKELAAATERKMSFLATKVQQQKASNEAFQQQSQQQQQAQQQQAQTVWCVQPAVVDVAWDENGQAWPEWGQSTMLPVGSAEGHGGGNNIFIPQPVYMGANNCYPQHSHQPESRAPVAGRQKVQDVSTRSGSVCGSSTEAATPPSQECAQEA